MAVVVISFLFKVFCLEAEESEFPLPPLLRREPVSLSGHAAALAEHFRSLRVASGCLAFEHGDVGLVGDGFRARLRLLSKPLALLPYPPVLAPVRHTRLEPAQPADYDVAVESVVEPVAHHVLAEASLDVAECEVGEGLVIENQLCSEPNLLLVHVALDVEEVVCLDNQHGDIHHLLLAAQTSFETGEGQRAGGTAVLDPLNRKLLQIDRRRCRKLSDFGSDLCRKIEDVALFCYFVAHCVS